MEPVTTRLDFDVAVARLRRQRTLRLVVTPLLLVAITLGADAVLRSKTRARALQRAADEWGAYTKCALGEPLHDGERATTRLSRIELNLPERGRPEGTAPWPARCAGHLDAIHDALTAGHLTRDRRLAELDRLASTARADIAPESAPDLPDHLWAAAADAALPAAKATLDGLDAPAPLPASPLTTATLPALPVEARVVPEEADRILGDGLRLLFAPASGDSTLCSFRTDGKGAPLRTAHCADNVAPTATDDATPGFLRSVKGRFDRFELIRPITGADPQIIPMPAGTVGIALFADQLLTVSSARHLVARTIPGGIPPAAPPEGASSRGANELGPTVDLGEIVGGSPEFAACRSETSLVARVRTHDDAAGPRNVFATLAFRTGDTWERVPGQVAVQVDADFTCRGREATFTWLDRDTLRQARCTPAGCATEASGPLTLPWDSGRPNRVTDLDGKAVLVGVGMTAGPVAAASVKTVRMRVAKAADLARAPDIVLLGDPAHDGLDVTDVHVYVRRTGALVLVTSEGREPFHAITVAPSGAFEALKVEKL